MTEEYSLTVIAYIESVIEKMKRLKKQPPYKANTMFGQLIEDTQNDRIDKVNKMFSQLIQDLQQKPPKVDIEKINNTIKILEKLKEDFEF